MEGDARGERLREAVRLWREGPRAPAGRGVELGPGSAYEAVTRQMVEALAEDLREIKGRLNGLLFMVAGTILVDVVVRVTGG